MESVEIVIHVIPWYGAADAGERITSGPSFLAGEGLAPACMEEASSTLLNILKSSSRNESSEYSPYH